MQITVTLDRAEEGPRSGPVTVGWFLTETKGAVIFDPPERLSSRPPNRGHAKSAARCPAVAQMEARYFAIACPYDLHIGFGRDDKGRPHLVNRAGAASAVRSAKLNTLLTLVAETEWRFPDRPTLQLSLPYCFVADEPVWLTQTGPFAHYRREALPGTIFGGRFPIHVWPRPLMWAFEWHDPERDIQLRRGEPLFYVQFEGEGPDRPVQVVEAERTAQLLDYMDRLSGVVNHVNQTFGLFKAAEKQRPPRLLTPRP
jgi:hypothetical protein